MAPSKADASVETPPAGGLELPDEALGRLAGSTAPFLIGVRHHSPVLAAAVPALLDAFRPDLLLVELPEELGGWLRWLGDPATVAPVALGAATGDGRGGLAFYPFADFSPELAAVRWAARNGVEVAPCDLPLADPAWAALGEPGADLTAVDSLTGRLRAAQTGRADDDLWDRLVEAAAPGCTPEQVRRAALAVGWAIRRDAGEVSTVDAARERWMRGRAAAAGDRRVAMVVGAFHAPALPAPTYPACGPASPGLGSAGSAATREGDASKARGPARAEASASSTVITSLVPYEFGLLDSRSGYGSGIRDPGWQQDVYECGADPAALEKLAVGYAVRVSAGLRAAGHPAGPAEAREAARLAIDLARLRGLPAPGRGELVEAIETVFAHGEVLGRGRAVADAMQAVFVGERIGRLAPGTPESGLVPAVLAELGKARLPGENTPRAVAAARPVAVHIGP